MTQRVILHHADIHTRDEVIEHPGPMTDREFALWTEGINAGACAASRMYGHPNTYIGAPIIDPCP